MRPTVYCIGCAKQYWDGSLYDLVSKDGECDGCRKRAPVFEIRTEPMPEARMTPTPEQVEEALAHADMIERDEANGFKCREESGVRLPILAAALRDSREEFARLLERTERGKSSWKEEAGKQCSRAEKAESELAATQKACDEFKTRAADHYHALAEKDAALAAVTKERDQVRILAEQYRASAIEHRSRAESAESSLNAMRATLDETRNAHAVKELALLDMVEALGLTEEQERELFKDKDWPGVVARRFCAMRAERDQAVTVSQSRYADLVDAVEKLNTMRSEVERMRAVVEAATGELGRVGFNKDEHIYTINRAKAILNSAALVPSGTERKEESSRPESCQEHGRKSFFAPSSAASPPAPPTKDYEKRRRLSRSCGESARPTKGAGDFPACVSGA